MKILYRLGFYLGGFSIGLILLAFFIKGSGVELPSCDYLPNARLLKTIRNNGYSLSTNAEKQLNELALDTTDLNIVFQEGEVDFSNSEPRKDPCGYYTIKSQQTVEIPLILKVERCDESFEVLNVIKQ